MLTRAGDLTCVRVRNGSSPAFPKRSPRRSPSSSSDRSWTIPTLSATLFTMNTLASTPRAAGGVAHPLPDRPADPYRGRTRRIPLFGHLGHMIPIAGNGDLHAPPTHRSHATLGRAHRRGSRWNRAPRCREQPKGSVGCHQSLPTDGHEARHARPSHIVVIFPAAAAELALPESARARWCAQVVQASAHIVQVFTRRDRRHHQAAVGVSAPVSVGEAHSRCPAPGAAACPAGPLDRRGRPWPRRAGAVAAEGMQSDTGSPSDFSSLYGHARAQGFEFRDSLFVRS